MRVLHLPVNVASQASASVRGLRAIGVESRGVVRGSDFRYLDDRGLSVYRISGPDPVNRLRFYAKVIGDLWWADVIHWHFAMPALPFATDLKLARWLRKRGVVEFWGSDIRIAEMEAADNPWFAARGDDYEYEAIETRARSWRRQERFSKNGVRTCLVTEPAMRFLKSHAFDVVVPTRTAVVLGDFVPNPPSPADAPLVVAHSPSAKNAKGTAAVLAAVDAVRQRHPIELRLMHGVSHVENLKAVASCDVFLDQFVEGTTYGVAAVEAMALGKPVVCWIKPAALKTFPPQLPVIIADQSGLAGTLEDLIVHRDRLPDLGRRSRAWVEKYHDATGRAEQLVELYARTRTVKPKNGRAGG